MNIIWSCLLTVLASANVLAAQAEELLKKTVNISDIDALVLEGPGRLNLYQGTTESLEIIANKKTMDNVEVKARGNQLRLRVNNKGNWKFFGFDSNVLYNLTLKNIETIEAKGSNNITVNTDIKSERLQIERAGSGNVDLMDLYTDKLHIEITGSSQVVTNNIYAHKAELEVTGSSELEINNLHVEDKIFIDSSGSSNIDIEELRTNSIQLEMRGASTTYIDSGSIEDQEVDISGAGKYKAPELESARAEIELSGASTAKVYVTESLEGNISGASGLNYYGQPAIEVDTSGAGYIKSLGIEPN